MEKTISVTATQGCAWITGQAGWTRSITWIEHRCAHHHHAGGEPAWGTLWQRSHDHSANDTLSWQRSLFFFFFFFSLLLGLALALGTNISEWQLLHASQRVWVRCGEAHVRHLRRILHDDLHVELDQVLALTLIAGHRVIGSILNATRSDRM